MRSIPAFAWLALAVGWCCHAGNAVSDSGPSGVPSDDISAEVASYSVTAANPEDALDEQLSDSELCSDEDLDELVVVHRRLLQSTQMQWDEMVSNKVETLQLMAQIRALMYQLNTAVSSQLMEQIRPLMYQLNTAVSSVRELDERCVHFTQRPRRVGSGSFMVAVGDIAMTVRGSLNEHERKRRRVSNSASSRQAVQAQQIQLG